MGTLQGDHSHRRAADISSSDATNLHHLDPCVQKFKWENEFSQKSRADLITPWRQRPCKQTNSFGTNSRMRENPTCLVPSKQKIPSSRIARNVGRSNRVLKAERAAENN